MSYRNLMVLGVVILTAACGASEPDAESREGAFDPLVETLDRAEAVDELARGRRDQLDAAREESER